LKSEQFSKSLNNTELGKSGTHDTYILVPKDVSIKGIFPETNTFYDFKDQSTGETVSIRNTEGREKRIVGLGPYYTKNDLNAGDEIILEKRDNKGTVKRLISYYKKHHSIVIQKYPSGFEILTPHRTKLIENAHTTDGKTVILKFKERKKKRSDSPEETLFYDLLIDDLSIADRYSTKEILEIEILNGIAQINKFCAWKKTEIETED